MPFPPGNRLLDALPPADAERVLRTARLVTLERRDRTARQNEPMLSVDFPVTALMSVSGVLENGTVVEVASIGTEAFVEIDAALESTIALRSASCQFPGTVVRVSLEDFQTGLERSRAFARLVRRAVRARVFVSEQMQMCSLKHTIVQRLARWLLLARDRLGGTEFPVTHDFLATILGTRRAGVSVAAANLDARHAITQQRGNVAILELDRLVEASCECYAACTEAIEESIGPAAFANGARRF